MMLILGYNEPQVDLGVKHLWLWSCYKLQVCSRRKHCSTSKPLTLGFMTIIAKHLECDTQCEQKVLPYILFQFEALEFTTIDNA